MKNKYFKLAVTLILALGLTSCSFYNKLIEQAKTGEELMEEHAEDLLVEPPEQILPISRANERVTKKPFGLKVSPADSPVSPEKFAGYHTATDFETFDNEQNVDVDIFAICTGPLKLKRFATGYGGVIVQECVINDEDVTVVYGHLKLSSIKAEINDLLSMGEKIGVLGDGFSDETDGERKHLHLGIHKGKEINILGYVQSESELEEWVDFMDMI